MTKPIKAWGVTYSYKAAKLPHCTCHNGNRMLLIATTKREADSFRNSLAAQSKIIPVLITPMDVAKRRQGISKK